LCGFSNFGSIGIQISALSTLAPKRTKEVVKIALQAMIAGNIACLMTACISGKYILVEFFLFLKFYILYKFKGFSIHQFRGIKTFNF
jgi:hypothetical protein